MKKAALHTLGCKVNSYETEAMQELLVTAGYEIVPFQEKADIYIINTCSVTNVADRKSRQMLHKAKKLNPQAVVVAAGCYVQAAKDQLLQDAAIDLVIGNNKKADLVLILEQYFQEKQSNGQHVIDISKTHEYESLRVSRLSDHTRAFIKVQDGCNQFCSYCIIPHTRGRIRSREISDVVSEVSGLVEKGYREVVLTGIHLSSFGRDRENQETLLDLITALNEIGGLMRIRLGSLEPRIVTEEFAQKLAGMEKVCPHFHLSLQSGCDATLKRMNRQYTTAEYRYHCEILRKYFHNPAITTDVIVGFPQETDEEFAQTMSFVKEIGFYEMHVFKYSKRAGTKAADMDGQVNESVKTIRSEQLIALNNQMTAQYKELFLGEKKEVLLEESIVLNGQEYMVGYTKEYLKAAVNHQNGVEKGTMYTGILNTVMENGTILLS